MKRIIDMPPIYFELFEAICHFMGRQALVIEAVSNLGILPENLAAGVMGWHGKAASRGQWGEEWDYGLHGSGCLIVNQHTGEPIDWNAPDPHAFDPYFFIHHLKWRLDHKADLPLLRAHIEAHGAKSVATLITDLVADGIISPEYHLNPVAVR
jgi:hypothetical protein